MSQESTLALIRKMRDLADRIAASEDDTGENFSELMESLKFIETEISTLCHFSISKTLIRENDSGVFFSKLNEIVKYREGKYLIEDTLLAAVERNLMNSSLSEIGAVKKYSVNVHPGIGISFVFNLKTAGKIPVALSWTIGSKRQPSIYPITRKDIFTLDLKNESMNLNSRLPEDISVCVNKIKDYLKNPVFDQTIPAMYQGKEYRCIKAYSTKEVNEFIQTMEEVHGQKWGLLRHDDDEGIYYVANNEDLGK